MGGSALWAETLLAAGPAALHPLIGGNNESGANEPDCNGRCATDKGASIRGAGFVKPRGGGAKDSELGISAMCSRCNNSNLLKNKSTQSD